MKKHYVISAILLAAVACVQKEANLEESQNELVEPVVPITYIEANRGITKSSVDGSDGHFSWNTGDQIAVYANGYKISNPLESTYDGEASAVFSFSGGNVVDQLQRTNFAVFPASLVAGYTTDVTAESFKITLPATYTLAQVQSELSPVPMIATNTPKGNLSFRNLCALVRITVNNLSKDTRSIKVTFPGKKVQGEFTLANVVPGSTPIVTSDTVGSDDTITITDLGITGFTSNLVINVPVPTGVSSSQVYTNVVVGAYDSGNHRIHSISTPIRGTSWIPSSTSACKVTAHLPVFTVSNDKKVVFAPGNLQAVLSDSMVGTVSSGHYFWGAKSWQFAPNQYTFIGNTDVNKLADPQEDDVIDLFSWVGESMNYSDGRKYGIFVFASSGGTSGMLGDEHGEELLADWGNNAIDAYQTGTWRTLSMDDWNVVLNEAGRTSSRFTKATLTVSESPLTTVNGLLVFPDQYTHPLDADFAKINRSGVTFAEAAAISLSDLALLEAAGCVFLPATGTRTYGSGRVISNTDYVVYWTSTSDAGSGNAKALYVTNSGVNGGQGGGYNRFRYYGCAVRLVRDVN